VQQIFAQVVRKWVHTPEPRSAPVSQGTQSKTDTAMDVLWKPRRQATGKGRGKVKKIVTEDERLHSLDAARLLDNTLRVGLGRRLSEFKMATPRIERLVDLVKEHKLSLEILALEFPFLALWMDKASQQVTAGRVRLWVLGAGAGASRPAGVLVRCTGFALPALDPSSCA
jgi:hypothetical protein